jgi:hypothetical protein
MNHFVEILADQVLDFAKCSAGSWIHLANLKVRIDQKDAKRRLIVGMTGSTGAQSERLFGGSAHVPELEQRTDAG